MQTLSPVWRLLILLVGLVLLAVPSAVRRAVFKPVASLPYHESGTSAEQDELESLRRRMTELSVLHEEDQRLIDAAARAGEFRALLARLGNEPVNWLSGVIAGARFGPGGDRYLVKMGQPGAVSPGAGVVKGYAAFGTITESQNGAGWVLPLDVPPSRTAVLVTRSRAEGLLEATPEGLFLRYVWASGTGTPPLAEGDVVVTSGRAGVFPRGVVVGRVKGGPGRSEDGLHIEAEIDPEFRYLPGDFVAVASMETDAGKAEATESQE